ncbi:MAG TPA: hypothetical protein PLD25_12895 [Chloroflexota bacterium]|nr:hypothetical protein [Chloroflexota bacterium]
MMADSQIPDTAQLADWLEGKLSPEDTAVLTQRIAANPSLQEEVAWLRDFWQLSQTTTLADPPASVRQTATAAFAAYAKNKRPAGRLQSLIATLTADNWQRPALAGARSGARHVSLRSEPRQLIYSSDLADIALNAHMRTDSQHIDLDGQVFPLDDSDPADFIIQLLQNGVERHLTFADTLGKFSLIGLPPDQYTLLLSRTGAEIEIGPLDLG